MQQTTHPSTSADVSGAGRGGDGYGGYGYGDGGGGDGLGGGAGHGVPHQSTSAGEWIEFLDTCNQLTGRLRTLSAG